MLKHILSALCLFFTLASLGQQALYNPSIDVQHYEFNVRVSDANDSLYGRAVITVRFTEKTNAVRFDLMNINDTARGMMVLEVKENGKPLLFTHRNNVINISLAKNAVLDEVRKFEISYKGIPADGLIISKNKFGHRTLFGDNWPNRARNWIPCKDHLSDKAAVDFIVTAPDHYKVVANGVKTEEKDLAGHFHLTHWKEEAPLPTKVMVIGIADFAVDYPGEVEGIPVSSWIFPEQQEKGFYDYAQALEILPYFIKNVGPYPYKKLANVQSKTIFGGMENAGAIFYYEGSVTGTRKSESLLAHEIAHQWFGDGATEADWPHIWLSEGFATEMTNLYMENKYGRDTLVKSLQNDRKQVIAFTKRKKVPVVDTSAGTNIMQLLNTNSYQKGGWVLHMLRSEVGDDVFWKSIRQYYAAFRGKNASSKDLQNIFEKVSGRDLGIFFNQWLYTPENPTLKFTWSYDTITKKFTATVDQLTNTVFVFKLRYTIGIPDNGGIIQGVEISQRSTTFTVSLDGRMAVDKVANVALDPFCELLFEGMVVAK
jgi:aminopeptidase N